MLAITKCLKLIHITLLVSEALALQYRWDGHAHRRSAECHDPTLAGIGRGCMFRGNGTIIGASVDVVIVEIVRKAGYQITFWRFFKFGFPIMVSSVALSARYLWLVFLR
jgi:Na+/H+ antiporter NhaD/arsenite permease-like protein